MSMEPIEIGDGVRLTFVTLAESDGTISGAIFEHTTPAGEPCDAESYIGLHAGFNTPSATWTVESWDPITLSPSLHCTRCGRHGFIRGGKWVPA